MNKRNMEYLERADYTWSADSIRFINTPTQSARQSFFYVQEVGYFKTSPPYFTERANLNSFLVFYTISGKGVLKYLGQTYELLPGTVVLIDCINHHYYECVSGQNWDFIWLHFNGATARGYYEEFMKSGFRVIKEMDLLFMEGTMRRILSLTQKKDLHSEIMVSSLILQVLTQLLIENSSENLGLGFMPSYIKDILKKIDKQFQEPLSLDDFAEEIGISKFHLSREFKRYIGVPLNEYLITIRLNHSKELLKYSALSVEEVAYNSGFHNVSHFINLFKKHAQATPLQYRKEWSS
ncbi:MAG: AraC family transcriptional regulator [Lachnospiraceae bacterium]